MNSFGPQIVRRYLIRLRCSGLGVLGMIVEQVSAALLQQLSFVKSIHKNFLRPTPDGYLALPFLFLWR